MGGENKNTIVIPNSMLPEKMYGLLLPHGLFVLSENIPINGSVIASHITDIARARPAKLGLKPTT